MRNYIPVLLCNGRTWCSASLPTLLTEEQLGDLQLVAEKLKLFIRVYGLDMDTLQVVWKHPTTKQRYTYVDGVLLSEDTSGLF